MPTTPEQLAARVKYRAAHAACPQCGAAIIRNTIGAPNFYDPLEDDKRPNLKTMTCDCGWSGTVDALVRYEK